jgi:hypothetical protein
MTILQKTTYLLDNGYIEQEHKELIKTFTSSNGYIRFSLRDIIYRWDSLRIF